MQGLEKEDCEELSVLAQHSGGGVRWTSVSLKPGWSTQEFQDRRSSVERPYLKGTKGRVGGAAGALGKQKPKSLY